MKTVWFLVFFLGFFFTLLLMSGSGNVNPHPALPVENGMSGHLGELGMLKWELKDGLGCVQGAGHWSMGRDEWMERYSLLQHGKRKTRLMWKLARGK